MKNDYKRALLLILLVPCWVIASKYNIDLVVLHHVMQLVHQGDYAHVYTQNGDLGRYFYGPISLVVFNPVGLVSFVVAKWAWIVLQTVCYVLFWRYLARLYPFLADNKTSWAWILVFIVSINPIHNNYQSNNIQLMLAALLLGAEILTRSSSKTKQALGGMLCVLAGMIKVFPLFLAAFYFVNKKRSVQLGLVIGFFLCVLIPFPYFGFPTAFQLTREFLTNLTTYSAQNSLTTVEDILCWPSLVTRWGNLESLAYGSAIMKGSVLAISAAFFAYAWKKRATAASDANYSLHLWALASALMVFLNPSTRPHYFIFYVPAFCSLLQILALATEKAYLLLLLSVSTLLIAFTAEGVVGKQLNDKLEMWSVPTVGMLLLCVGLMVCLFIPVAKRNRKI